MQMSKIKFSVVIPTCDRPALLKETLKSVFSQSLSPSEVIIVDNGINQIGAEVFKRDKKIKYIRALPRIGVAQARNIGICSASGDYLAFLDDDDLWDENYLREVARVIDTTNISVVLGGVKALETGRAILPWSQPIKSLEYFKDQLLRTNPGVVGSNTVIKRDLVIKFHGFDPFLTTGEDRALVLDLLLKHNTRVVRAEKALTYYRTDNKSGRLTDRGTLLRGKTRFLFKYWKIMDFSTRFQVLLKLLKLGIKNIIGVDYIIKRDE